MTEEWRRLAKKVRNWRRWGDDDQLGTLNFITPAVRTAAAALVKKGTAVPLAIPLDGDGPWDSHGVRRNPVHLMLIDGANDDAVQRLNGWGPKVANQVEGMYNAGSFRFTEDWIIMPLQASTQWDALCHAYYDGQLYNGFPAEAITALGATRVGIDAVAAAGGVNGRGVLLDVARHRGVGALEPGTAILPEELDAVATAQNVKIKQGDIVVVRTGWWERFGGVPDDEWVNTAPGVSWRVAEWLSDHRAAAIACDNPAVEPTVSEDGVIMPFHMLALRDMGLMLGELWNLSQLSADCAADGVYEFFLSAPALNVTGGTGTPVNPIAFK